MTDIFSTRIREALKRDHVTSGLYRPRPERDAWWHRNGSRALGALACLAVAVTVICITGVVMAGHP